MVGKKIRAYREFRGYSQIQLAELSGINVGKDRKSTRLNSSHSTSSRMPSSA